MPFAAQARLGILRLGLAALIVSGTAFPHRAVAASSKPRIEGLTLKMSPEQVMKASPRPCRYRAFLPDFPGLICADPGETNVGMNVGFVGPETSRQAFALLLRFCSHSDFQSVVGEIQNRYRVAMTTRSTIVSRSRGSHFGNGLVLTLSQNGICTNGGNRFDLMLADQRAYASEATKPPIIDVAEPRLSDSDRWQ